MTPFNQIEKAYHENKVAGSWLIIGDYGVGKKHFAQRVCSLLLNQNFNDFNSFHPDVKWLECGLTEDAKKEIQKSILAGKTVEYNSENTAQKREITVDDLRESLHFLSLKGAENKQRILIINRADQMNEHAENALLKVLEEPPKNCVILLLCQNMGKLLPTIISRCRKIVLTPKTKTELISELRSYYPMADDIEIVADLANGSLGIAKDIYENNGVAIYKKITTFFVPFNELDLDEVKNFTDEVSKNPKTFQLVKFFAINFLQNLIKKQALIHPFYAEDLLDLYNEINQLFVDVDRIYLDKKQVLTLVLTKIAGVLNDR